MEPAVEFARQRPARVDLRAAVRRFHREQYLAYRVVVEVRCPFAKVDSHESTLPANVSAR
jgi:hypothetical protein